MTVLALIDGGCVALGVVLLLALAYAPARNSR